MNLMYDRLSKSINIKNNDLTIIGTNNAVVYVDLSLGLQGRKDCLKLIDENYHFLEIDKVVDYEGNVIDNKNLFDKYKKTIISQTISSLNSNQLQEILLKQSEIHTLAEKNLNEDEQIIIINNLCDIRRVYSSRNVDFTVFKSSHPYDIIKSDIKIHSRYLPNKLLIVSNMSHYLLEDDLFRIQKQLQKYNVNLLDLDFFELNKSNTCLEHNYYIDNDFEIWHF